MKKRKTKKKLNQLTKARHSNQLDYKLPFIAHLYELRKRLFYVVASVLFFATLGYFIQESLVKFLLAPAKNQQFIYTSPGGGLNFLFQVCLYFGMILSVPVLIYQFLCFIQPLIYGQTRQIIIRYSVISTFLAMAGASFGYFLGLPIAISFLARQFTTVQIKPLLTINEYMSFVLIYLIGCALLFQLPLIIMFINRITPLKPSKLVGFERYLILIAFIAAAIMTPTPDVFNQLLFAGPIIVIYQLSIVLVYIKNRRPKRNKKVLSMLEQDEQIRARQNAVHLKPLVVNSKPQSLSVAIKPQLNPKVKPQIIKRPTNYRPAKNWDILPNLS
jgi:sec-independent protein translocase protein TatC